VFGRLSRPRFPNLKFFFEEGILPPLRRGATAPTILLPLRLHSDVFLPTHAGGPLRVSLFFFRMPEVGIRRPIGSLDCSFFVVAFSCVSGYFLPPGCSPPRSRVRRAGNRSWGRKNPSQVLLVCERSFQLLLHERCGPLGVPPNLFSR